MLGKTMMNLLVPAAGVPCWNYGDAAVWFYQLQTDVIIGINEVYIYVGL